MVVTLSRNQLIAVAVLAVVLLVVGAVLGRSCVHTPVAPPTSVVTGIDAAPGEEIIAGQLDGAVQAGQQHIQQIEAKFDGDMRAFDDQQAAEYAQLRGGGDLDGAAAYLSEWNHVRRARKAEAGVP